MSRLLGAALGIGSLAAILTAPGALAAYGSPRLEASHSGNSATIEFAQSASDDPTAVVRLILLGPEVGDPGPAGTELGTASATFIATTAGDRELTAQGSVEVVDPGPVAPSAIEDCAAGERVEAVWHLRLALGADMVSMPLYVVGGNLLLCVPHPSALAQGAKLVGLTLTLERGLTLRASGTWVSIWVPYGAVEADPSRAVASPAVFGAGTVEFTARARGSGATLRGIVLQAGAPRARVRVRITGGPRAAGGSVLGTATTNGAGRFTFRAKSGTFFRATASVGRAAPPGLCFVLEPALRPIPCVNPTLNGFSVQSRTIRKR